MQQLNSKGRWVRDLDLDSDLVCKFRTKGDGEWEVATAWCLGIHLTLGADPPDLDPGTLYNCAAGGVAATVERWRLVATVPSKDEDYSW